MFFGKKKNTRGKERSRPRSERTLNEFGLPVGPSNDDDDDLEAELFKLTGQKSSQPDELLLTGDDDADIEQELALLMGNTGRGPRATAGSTANPRLVDVTAAGSVDISEDGDDDEIDENDPDLLGELAMLTTNEDEGEINDPESPPAVEEKPNEINQLELIRARLAAYKLAEANAKKSNETSRARRFNRGVKTLEKLLKKVSSGEFVPFDEIPPEIATNLKPASNYPVATTVEDGGGASHVEPIPSSPHLPSEPAVPEPTTSATAERKEEPPKEINQRDLILSRLEAYRAAESNAKKNNEPTRARRFNRGVKTLENLLKKVTNGEFVPFDEIPPEIATNLKPASEYPEVKLEDVVAEDASTEPSPILPVEPLTSLEPAYGNEEDKEESKKIKYPAVPKNPPSNVKQAKVQDSFDSSMLSKLETRREEFKAAALNAKKRGDLASALTNVKSVKTCDRLISELKAGKTINDTEVPQPLGASKPTRERLVAQGSSYSKNYNVYGEIFEIPGTVMEALEQRLAYYEKAFKKAEASNNRVEARRHGDVVRVYQNAIRLHKKGSRVPFEKLPSPPGCPPIPLSF